MTFKEAYTSLLKLYKNLMFPASNDIYGGRISRTGWTMKDIDEMDAFFFEDLLNIEPQEQQEEDVYLSDIW